MSAYGGPANWWIRRGFTGGTVLNLDAGDTRSYPGSGNTWSDLSGSNNNGTLVNGAVFNSSNGGNIVFDGVDNTVTVTASDTLGKSTSWTTSAWVRYSDVGYTSWMMICDSGGGNDSGRYLMWLNDSAPATGKLLGFYDVAWQYGTVRISPNVWTHVCLSKSVNSVSFYTNGVFDVTRTVSFTGTISSTNVDIGYSSRNPTYPFNGNIAQVSIFDRALSATEIGQIYNAYRSRFGL